MVTPVIEKLLLLKSTTDDWKCKPFRIQTQLVSQWIPLNALFPSMCLLFAKEQITCSSEVLKMIKREGCEILRMGSGNDLQIEDSIDRSQV